MRKDCRHLRDLQLLTKDLLTLEQTRSDALVVWEAERSSLATECLRASGRLRLRVRGESMLPSLWPGEVVEIARCGIEDVRPGDVVLALREGRFFLHRLRERRGHDIFVLQGDSMPSADPEFLSEALLGRLNRSRPLRAWSRALGLFLCYCGPARRLALILHFKLAHGAKAPQGVLTAAPELTDARA